MNFATRRGKMRSFLFCFVLAACAGEDLIDDEIEVGADDSGKADAASELRVRTGDTSVWVDRALERRETAGGSVFVLRGRASRNVADGNAFVFDDPYGDFAKRTARTFEISWPIGTARSLVDGVDQFVRLQFTHSSGRPDALTARAVVRPRFTSFSGSPGVYVTAELTPVVVAGEVLYRVQGHTSARSFVLSARLAGLPHPVRRIDDTRFEIDLRPEQAFAIAGVATANLEIKASLESGNVAKVAQLGIAIKKLALTAGDPYAHFPRPDCATATRSCLVALPDGALDLATCGEAVVVQSCAGRIGLFAGDVEMQAAIAHGTQITGSPAFRSDAAGLVGLDRVDQLQGGAEQTIDDRASHVFGRWFMSATARDATFAAAVDGAIHDAYARPLDVVEPHAPHAGDAAATRQVAADALLRELATFDFVSSEFGRSYDDLIREFRDTHVASLREMRETDPVEPYPSHPELDLVTGQWLGTHVEVSISHATGAATHTLIEID